MARTQSEMDEEIPHENSSGSPTNDGAAPAFPPSEETPPPATIGSTSTTASDGLIGDANSTHSDLGDC